MKADRTLENEMNTYHYTECGLRNVFVEDLAMHDDHGDETFKIPRVNQLHREIARGIVMHNKGISGGELRFLRSEMGLTQAELGNLVHHDGQSIGRWERNEIPIDGSAETIIRRLAIEKLNLDVDLDTEGLSRRSVSTVETQPINIRHSDAGYKLQAA